MESTSLDIRAFAFIISLAAVINGLGIVRWLTVLSEYLVQKRKLDLQHYWVFSLLTVFQFLLHILMWWSMWAFRDATNVNFLTYLYLLAGPIILFLGTSALIPNIEGKRVNVQGHFSEVRPLYSTVLVLLWIWALFAGPVMRGALAPTAPLLLLFLAAAVLLRVTTSHKAHAVAVVFSWLVVVAFIAMFAMQLGGNAIQTG